MEKLISPTLRSYVLRKHWLALLLSLVLIGAGIYISMSNSYSHIWLELKKYWGLITGIGIIVLLYVAVESELHHITTKLYFTPDEYIVYEKGIIRHEKKKAGLDEITDTAIEQSILDRVLNTCTLKINTGGSMEYEIVMHDVDAHIADALHDTIVRKRRRG